MNTGKQAIRKWAAWVTRNVFGWTGDWWVEVQVNAYLGYWNRLSYHRSQESAEKDAQECRARAERDGKPFKYRVREE